MKVCLSLIIEYLQKKIKNKLTGSVKLSFESGAIVGICEANKFDLPTTECDADTIETIEKYIVMAKDTSFNGAVIFVFLNGKIIEYAYSRTYKGDLLQKCLTGK